jgi:hypothetical protein
MLNRSHHKISNAAVKLYFGFTLMVLVPEGRRIVSLYKKKKKKRGVLKQDDDRRPFVRDTVDPALSATIVMLRDKVWYSEPDRGKSRGRHDQHESSKLERQNWGWDFGTYENVSKGRPNDLERCDHVFCVRER